MQENLILRAKIKPNSKEFRIDMEKGIIYCKSPPVNNKANLEIIKELKTITKREVKIISGLNSKNKRILINNLTIDDFKRVIK
ncbi:MAG: DUF167 domain-containing protein [Candidatus Aenigmarchaeota archaeon]|nr:DUF167 domain-containing protein [Candidatus Aenigmarchaeota archaeon]